MMTTFYGFLNNVCDRENGTPQFNTNGTAQFNAVIVNREYDTLLLQHRQRGGGRQFQSFSIWLDSRIELLVSQNVHVSPEVRNLANLPKSEIEEYRGMSAYGNHYRIEDPLEGNPYKTYDSGVACIASTLCQFSATDRRPVQANLEYVGVLRKIIRLDYNVLQINVMSCDWIKPNVT